METSTDQSQQIKLFFSEETDYVSFDGHQSQIIELIKALYDMYKCILIIFREKGA